MRTRYLGRHGELQADNLGNARRLQIQGEKHFKSVDSDDMRYDFHLDSSPTARGLGCYD